MPFILIGVLLFRFGKSKQIYQVAGIIVAALAALFLILAGVSLVPKFIELRHAYKNGNSSTVEGVVENFHPAPVLGVANESFSVDGVDFSYNALNLTTCFHNPLFAKARLGLVHLFVFPTKMGAFGGLTCASESNGSPT